MHSKVLVVDGRDALVTSANFTHHGLNENVELGVRLKGTHAGSLRSCVREMVSARLFHELAVGDGSERCDALSLTNILYLARIPR